MSEKPVKSIFEYTDYRNYLAARFSIKGSTRGLRTLWAKQIRVQPPFITLVLQRKMDLGPEHIPPTNEFLNHSKLEAHFFTLLVLRERAATQKLKQYYDEQIQEVLEKRKSAAENTRAQNVLSNTDQAIYFSQWYYSAIRILASITKYQNRIALSERLNLPLSRVTDAVETLIRLGLIEEKNGRLSTLEKLVFLKADSPYRTQMHTHLRNRAIHCLSNPEPRDYHASYNLSMNYENFEKFRKSIIAFLDENKSILEDSPEEEAFALTIDFFKLA